MTAAALRAAPALILAGCAAYATRDRIRTAALHARWAWHCHGLPPPGSEIDPLDRRERMELLAIRRSWGKTAHPERSRT